MSLVRLERDREVAIIVIDNPPINAGSLGVRRGLLAAIEAVNADPDITAAVIIGAGRTFIAGSDIREFGIPLERPELPEVIAAIEASDRPFIAALHGSALGGGYELALGCDMRIASPTALVGLPEVTLGMIPGAGGTQRLPRLVGLSNAIDLICAGRRVGAHAARVLGMIDEVADGALRDVAVDRARTLKSKARVLSLTVPQEPREQVQTAVSKSLKEGRNRPAVEAAVRAIQSSVKLTAAEALANERATFTTLRMSREAAALRHLFFAERAAARPPQDGKPFAVRHVGVVGAGTMGAGIAAAFLGAGLQVTLVDSDQAALARAQGVIDNSLERWLKSGRIPAGSATSMRTSLSTFNSIERLSACECIIEAIVERLDAKRALLRQLDELVRPDAIIASNTSYLDLDSIGQSAKDPSRFLGMHFFNPAQTMRLLEVVRGAETSNDTLTTGLALAKAMGKHAVVARPGHGFIGNRIYAAYRRQCEIMVEDGAWPQQIDAALEAFGFAMGPFATSDLSGLDIAWAMRKAQAATRDPSQRYVDIPDYLCELGRLGRKTGKGWYRYSADKKRGSVDPVVQQIIKQASAAKGIERREFTDQEIIDRVLATMVNEAALLLEEGVARQPGDIDVVFVHGYGFPRHEGGPLFYAAHEDRRRFVDALDDVERATGVGFRRGNIDRTLSGIGN